MGKEYILTHDIGTSGIKTAVFAFDGSIIDSEASSHKTYTSGCGTSEQDASDWWSGICQNTGRLLERDPALHKCISIIAVSGIMLGCLPVDSSGNELRRCLIHSDTRAEEQFRKLIRIADEDGIYRITGNVAEARSSLCKMMWIKENEPDIYNAAARFVQAKDYVTIKMTGNIDITDFSDASHAQFMDIRKKTYAKSLIKDAGLDTAKLPSIYKSTDIVGRLSADGAAGLGLLQGIPVIAGAGDGACATAGAGISRPGMTYCCLGTTAWIANLSVEPVIDAERRLFNIMSADNECFGIYGTVQSACRSLQWVMDLFGEHGPELVSSACMKIPPGSDGLIFLPYIEGERSPVFDPGARGVFLGISPEHGKSHFYRAVLEGVAYALKSILEVFKVYSRIDGIRLIGGGARSDLWKGIICDIFGIPVQTPRISAEYATSLGLVAAACAALGLDPPVTRIGSEIDPDLINMEIYGKYYEVYKSIYPGTKDLFRKLRTSCSETGGDNP